MRHPIHRRDVCAYAGLAVAAVLQAAAAQAQPVTTTPKLNTDSAEAAEDINRLESPDGPRVESGYGGSSALTGVLVDRTRTVVGHNFYRAFSQIAMEHPIIRGATLTIYERPDAVRGIQLWVAEGQRIYFRTQMSPRPSDAEDIAREAISIVEEAVLKRQLSDGLNQSADLGEEEF